MKKTDDDDEDDEAVESRAVLGLLASAGAAVPTHFLPTGDGPSSPEDEAGTFYFFLFHAIRFFLFHAIL